MSTKPSVDEFLICNYHVVNDFVYVHQWTNEIEKFLFSYSSMLVYRENIQLQKESKLQIVKVVYNSDLESFFDNSGSQSKSQLKSKHRLRIGKRFFGWDFDWDSELSKTINNNVIEKKVRKKYSSN